MPEWIVEEVPAVTIDGKVISTMYHELQKLVRCKDCKHHGKDTCSAAGGITYPPPNSWFCADGERSE